MVGLPDFWSILEPTSFQQFMMTFSNAISSIQVDFSRQHLSQNSTLVTSFYVQLLNVGRGLLPAAFQGESEKGGYCGKSIL